MPEGQICCKVLLKVWTGVFIHTSSRVGLKHERLSEKRKSRTSGEHLESSSRVSHLQLLQRAAQLLQAAACRPGWRQQGVGVGQEPLQLAEAAAVQLPVAQQPLHQGAPLLGTLHRPLPVLPQLRQLQDEVAPGGRAAS